jgi:hypothetical protein
MQQLKVWRLTAIDGRKFGLDEVKQLRNIAMVFAKFREYSG